MSEKVTILCASGYGKDYNPSELMRKSAGRGIRTPAAPRGHKLLGPLKGGISRLAPYLARRPRHHASIMLCVFIIFFILN